MDAKNKISHLIFDFDGTIADSLPLQIEIYNEIAAKYGAEYLPQEKIDDYRQLTIIEFLKQRRIPLTKLPFLLKEGRELLRQKIDKLQPIPGMKAALQSAADRNLQLGVVTSNAEDIVKKFAQKNNLPEFSFIYSEFNLFGKQRKLAKVLDSHHLQPQEVIYVGDETRDIEAAQHNNITAWAVTWGLNSLEVIKPLKPGKIFSTPGQLQKSILSLTMTIE